jgi:hypothetical protein
MIPTPAEVLAARVGAGLTQVEAAELVGRPRLWWIRRETGEIAFYPHEWAHWKHVAGIDRVPFKARSV